MRVASAQWNDEMYRRHSTPYCGLAGVVEAVRVKAVLKAADISSSDDLLEVGCEAGHLLESFPPCRKTVGFDISQAALADAETRFRVGGKAATFICGDASEPLPFRRGEFSIIVCSEMLEHVPDPRLCLANIAAVAAPDTRIILTVPNELPKLRLKSLLRRVGLMKMFMPGIEEAQSEWHLQCFDAAKLRDVCHGLVRIDSLRSVLGLHWLAVCRLV